MTHAPLEILLQAALEVEQLGKMKPACMGKGEGVWHGSLSRGDSTLWITDGIGGKGQLPEVTTAEYARRVPLSPVLSATHSDARGSAAVNTAGFVMAGLLAVSRPPLCLVANVSR